MNRGKVRRLGKAQARAALQEALDARRDRIIRARADARARSAARAATRRRCPFKSVLKGQLVVAKDPARPAFDDRRYWKSKRVDAISRRLRRTAWRHAVGLA